MGYIGSDPKNNESVSTSQLVDDAVTNAKLVDDVLFSSVTSSIVSASGNITADTFTGTFNGALSSSAQISSNISGSFTPVSTSLASRVTTNEADLTTLKGSGTTQGVGQSNSPTFTAITVNTATVTGTLTAQEVHTEFESASILFTSGSTQFGNSSDDVHEFKGNLISGSLTSTASLAVISLADKIEHIGDTNNTIEFGTDEIKLRTGGGSRLIARDSNVELYNDLVVAGAATFNEDSGDKDFRVESNGNANMLFVDGGNNRVGIGTNTPDYIFDVESSSTTFMRLLSTNTNGVAGLYMENDTVKWYIDTHGGVSDSFLIGEENVLGGTALSITTGNNVGIGTQTPTNLLTIHAGTSTDGDVTVLRLNNDETALADGDGVSMEFGLGTDFRDAGKIGVFASDNSHDQYNMRFSVRNTSNALAELVRIVGDGGKVGFTQDGATGAPSSSLHIRANEPNIILQDMNHAPASSVALNANSSTAGLEIGADVQGKYSGTTISFQIDGTERVKFEDAATEYTAEFKGDVKILDNNSDPRLLIGDSTSANEYGEVSYDSSENELRLGIQGNEDTIVMDSSANVEFKSLITAPLFRTSVTTTSVANASWTNISGLTSLSAGLYIVHVYKDNYAANDWSARGIVEATGHSTIDGDFENQTGFQLRVDGSNVQVYHTLGSTFGITARWIRIG